MHIRTTVLRSTTALSLIAAVTAVAAVAAGCAAAGGGAGTVADQQRIAALSASDVGLCYPAPIPATSGVNPEVLTGMLVAARPGVMECLVDPRSRGQAKETQVTLKTTAGGGKLEHAVTGANLSPTGEQCIRAALDKHFASADGFAAQAAAVTSPATGEAQVTHVAGVSPSVELGLNEASDVTGAIRIAQSSWCDCYAEWKSAPPHPLTATITVKQGAPPQATFEPAKDPAAQKVAACLTTKIAALPLKAQSASLTVPYSFLFIHSGQASPLTDLPPAVQLRQLDALRTQRAARAVIALGGRTSAAVAYDVLVKKFQEAPDSVPVEDLTKGCAALLAADDSWLAAMTQQLEIDQQTLTLVQQLKAQDPAYERAEAAAKAGVETTKQDIETAKQMKVSDTGACPRDAK